LGFPLVRISQKSVDFFFPENQAAAEQRDGQGKIQPCYNKHEHINTLGKIVQQHTNRNHAYQGQEKTGAVKFPEPGILQLSYTLDVPPAAAGEYGQGLHNPQHNSQADEEPVPGASGSQFPGLGYKLQTSSQEHSRTYIPDSRCQDYQGLS
jgi:hypothetical protein